MKSRYVLTIFADEDGTMPAYRILAFLQDVQTVSGSAANPSYLPPFADEQGDITPWGLTVVIEGDA